MMSACKTVGVVMTRFKLAVTIMPEGFDALDETPIIRIWGDPKPWFDQGKIGMGKKDIKCRPRWSPGWRMILRIRFDSGMITKESIVNLVNRVGQQVGFAEGRPDSPNSAGMDYGLFKIDTEG